MGNAAFGWQNAVKTATLTSTSAEALLPVSNLANDQGAPSMGWQTLAGALSPTLTITFPTRSNVLAIGVFRTNLTTAGTMQAKAYTNPGATLIGTAALTSFNNGQAIALFGSTLAADYVTIAFADTLNPDNHLNVPLVFVGPLWQPTTGFSWQMTIGRDDIADVEVTRSGQTWPNLRSTVRRLEIAMEGVRINEAYAQLDVLDRASRLYGNVLAIPDVTATTMQFEATFGILKATADVAFPYSTLTRRSWRARVTERL